MRKELKELLVCPHCKGELQWEVHSAEENHIVEASMSCHQCGQEYFVRDRVAGFLPEQNEADNWKQVDSEITEYFRGEPEAERKLLSTPESQLNAADLYVLANLMEGQGKKEEAYRLRELSYYQAYTKESLEAGTAQWKYVSDQLSRLEDGFAVDLASGLGRLAEVLLKGTKLHIVATDISFPIMKRFQENHPAQADRISCLVFDVNQLPFRDRSIPVFTSYAGMQNVGEIKRMLQELHRVCTGDVYSICSFCPEEDSVNREALRRYNMERWWVKPLLLEDAEQAGWYARCENGIQARTAPTPDGEIAKGFRIDGFPVADTMMEYCTLHLVQDKQAE